MGELVRSKSERRGESREDEMLCGGEGGVADVRIGNLDGTRGIPIYIYDTSNCSERVQGEMPARVAGYIECMQCHCHPPSQTQSHPIKDQSQVSTLISSPFAD